MPKHPRVQQPDGSYCYAGSTCRKHQKQASEQKLNKALDKQTVSCLPEPSVDSEDLPEWFTEQERWYRSAQQESQRILEETGLTRQLTIPVWNQTATEAGLLELTIDEDTSLLVEAQEGWSRGIRRSYTIWLMKQRKAVTMMRILTSPAETQERWGETTLCDIETREAERGQGFAMETIRAVEAHLINTRIHSGGHYTPEGEHALKGRLPYTQSVLQEVEREKELMEQFGRPHVGLPAIGVHYSSMNFVEDWESFSKRM